FRGNYSFIPFIFAYLTNSPCTINRLVYRLVLHSGCLLSLSVSTFILMT
ncbi:hypothetical protein LINPERHAP1_LOCUS34284, partial [Linum perenne]